MIISRRRVKKTVLPLVWYHSSDSMDVDCCALFPGVETAERIFILPPVDQISKDHSYVQQLWIRKLDEELLSIT